MSLFGERLSEAAFTQGYICLNDSFATKQKFKLLININQNEKHKREGRDARFLSSLRE
jgi:hypothetical protein